MFARPLWDRRLPLALVLAVGIGLAASTAQAEELGTSDPATRVMVEGSLEVSRTKVKARRFMASALLDEREISRRAELNYREAARFVAQSAKRLPLNLDTAIQLNRIVTRGLVPDEIRGDPKHRPRSTSSHATDSFVGGDVMSFYGWLAGDGAKLGLRNPVDLAEKIHHNMSALDSFPDGNGRTARLMADLALLKHGRAPALYTDMGDYFARGNARSPVSRAARVEYFRSIAARGQARLRQLQKEGSRANQARRSDMLRGRTSSRRPSLNTRSRARAVERSRAKERSRPQNPRVRTGR